MKDLCKQNRVNKLVDQGLMIIKEKFDNMNGNDVIKKTMDISDDLCKSKRFGRMGKKFMPGQGDVTEITEKFIWLPEFH